MYSSDETKYDEKSWFFISNKFNRRSTKGCTKERNIATSFLMRIPIQYFVMPQKIWFSLKHDREKSRDGWRFVYHNQYPSLSILIYLCLLAVSQNVCFIPDSSEYSYQSAPNAPAFLRFKYQTRSKAGLATARLDRPAQLFRHSEHSGDEEEGRRGNWQKPCDQPSPHPLCSREYSTWGTSMANSASRDMQLPFIRQGRRSTSLSHADKRKTCTNAHKTNQSCGKVVSSRWRVQSCAGNSVNRFDPITCSW